MSQALSTGDDRDMPIYLIEVQLANASEVDLERAVRMLDAAMSRMPDSTNQARTITAGHTRDDGRLVCLIEAASADAARRLLGVALLPGGRIREITLLAGTDLLGHNPGGDAGPGVDAELIEDVVDVGLDGALRQE
jgi:hypothetical protein